MSNPYITVNGKQYVDSNWVRERHEQQKSQPLNKSGVVKSLERVAESMEVSDFSGALSGSKEQHDEQTARVSIATAIEYLKKNYEF